MPKLTEEEIAELRALCEKATPGPWCWESVAEKSNEFVVGLACNKNGEMLSGCINGVDYDEQTCAYIEDSVIRSSVVGANEDGNANFSDAALIAAARTALPDLLSDLEEARRERDERADYKLIHDAAKSRLTKLFGEGALLAQVSRVEACHKRAESAERALAEARQGCPICRHGVLGSDGYIKTDGIQYVSFRCTSCNSLFLSDCTRERWLALPAPPAESREKGRKE